MAHKKAGGSTALGRDSQAQRLGVKLYAGEMAQPGVIIIRQRGTKFRPGLNVKRGSDDTLFALSSGVVQFTQRKLKRFDGNLGRAIIVNVIPEK